MRKDLKQYNRITLTLYFVGVMLFPFMDGTVSKIAIVYALLMGLYILMSELYNFYLWESSEHKEKVLKALIERKEQQHDTTRND